MTSATFAFRVGRFLLFFCPSLVEQQSFFSKDEFESYCIINLFENCLVSVFLLSESHNQLLRFLFFFISSPGHHVMF